MAMVDTELPGDVVQGFCAEAEDPDAALAKLFQEQEHAWFLAVGGDEADFQPVGTEQADADVQQGADGTAASGTAESLVRDAGGTSEDVQASESARYEYATKASAVVLA
jgi:hypothetical protein